MSINVQDTLLNVLCEKQIPITLYLMNGIKLEGIILQATQSAILLQQAPAQWVNKGFIATLKVT